jgi:hypothetical protein
MTVMNEVNARTAGHAAGARAIHTAVLDDPAAAPRHFT